MRRGHIVAAAVLVGIATAIGTYAVTRTTALGTNAKASSHKAVDLTVAVQTRRLDAFEASLRKTLARKPPKLPRLPKPQAKPQAPARVIYSAAPAPVSRVYRPAPVTTVTRRAASAAPAAYHGEHDSEGNHASSGGDHANSGGGHDD